MNELELGHLPLEQMFKDWCSRHQPDVDVPRHWEEFETWYLTDLRKRWKFKFRKYFEHVNAPTKLLLETLSGYPNGLPIDALCKLMKWSKSETREVLDVLMDHGEIIEPTFGIYKSLEEYKQK